MHGRANVHLARGVAEVLGIEPVRCTTENFPDGEIHVRLLEPVRGGDVFIVQPVDPPIAQNLLELMLLSDAVRREGAFRVTAVIPYLGYSRQDRRSCSGEPVGARVIADILNSGFDRLITVDLHKQSLEGFFAIPVEHLSAVSLLAQTLQKNLPANPVLVAPDLGAAKLVNQYAEILDLPVAYLYKVRKSGKEVSVRSIVGNINGFSPILVDDMISTGGTMMKGVEALLAGHCLPDVTLVASHGLFVGKAMENLEKLPLKKVIVTDSISQENRPLEIAIEVAGLQLLIAETITRLHE
jgi:ribose-phosphate pyrophosphokinase